MNDKLFKKIKIASDKYDKYLSACAKVAIEAQKHIDWNQDVGCCYAPGDGVCIEIESHLCPATRFFELMEFIGNDMIDEKTYLSNCI
jgi:NAD(P)H-dependent FMN reductase